jgi:CheY-like chemotaxis protein
MRTVLVVDDDADLRAALAAVLEDAGHRVLLAENGVEALQVLDQEQVDLALVDVMMPVMDGLQLHDRIRGGTRCPALPMMFLTASRLSPQAIAPRVVQILHKPVTVDALLAAVDKLGE